MEIYDGWKNPRKFFVFRKTSIHDKIFISAYSPFLDEAKDTIFILVACPGEIWQTKKCLWLTGFSKVPNTVRSYVTFCKIKSFHSLFFSVFLCYLFHIMHYTIFYLLTGQRWLSNIKTSFYGESVTIDDAFLIRESEFLVMRCYAEIPVFFRSAQNGQSGVFGWTLRAQKWKSPWNIYIFERS